jgi:ATP-binding cassette, subfamily B (MDR/TAP), member 10
VPCVAGMAIIYGRYVRNITKTLHDQYAEIMKIAEERLGNVKTVKIFCRKEYENKLCGQKLKNALDLGYNEVKARAGFYEMVCCLLFKRKNKPLIGFLFRLAYREMS